MKAPKLKVPKLKIPKLKPKASLALYYLVIFALSFAVGYYAKSLAKKYVTAGFDDAKIKVSKSNYSSKEISEKVKEIQQKQEEEAAAAQAGTAGSSAAGTDNTEGSCGE